MLQNPWHRFLLVMALVLAANSLYLYFNPQTEPEPVAEIAYSRFKNELRQGHVVAVTIEGTLLTGRFLDAISFSSAELVNTSFEGYRAYELFRTTLPPLDDPQLFQLLDNSQVVVEARQKQEPSPLSSLLVALLPWIIIIGVWVYILRRMREGGPAGRLLGQFGKSGAHLYMPKTSPVTFDDVAGLAEAKQELQDIIVFLRSPAKFTRLDGRVPRGILLVGPPGTGKTLMARAVAGEAGVPFYNISASQFIEMFVGVGASRVRDLFNNAKKNAPSIIFVDELDAVGRARGTGLGGGHDEREQTLNQLLSELDCFEPHDEVIVMAATNRPDVLDSDLLRPGRFDRQVVIERPDWRDRVKILQVHTRKIPLAEDVDLARIAKGTPGMVGADLQSLVNEAALIAAREDAEQVDNQHLDQAKDRQLMGMERKLFLSDREKRITAYHEAGHTLVGRGLPGTDPVHKVTIIPRGQALGVTQQLPEDDRYQFQRSYLMGRLAVLLGGRAAEKMVFSEKTAWLIDQEIEKLITTAAECAEQLLEMNRPLLDALATFLVEEETLDAERLAEIFAAAELKSPPGLLEMLGGKDG